MSLQTIALFPIPECVVFPGTVMPLHVFEPRYRNMIEYCLREQVWVGICHTQKIIHEHIPQQDVASQLQHNQSTYKPFSVFGAGPCELVQTLEDGRLLVNISIEKRFEAINEVQTLPFSLFDCREIIDQELNATQLQQAAQLTEKILMRLKVLASKEPAALALLSARAFQTMGPQEFSLQMFQLIQFPADTMQVLLETCDAQQRLEYVLKLINDNLR